MAKSHGKRLEEASLISNILSLFLNEMSSPVSIIESQNSRLERTSRIFWADLSWENHREDDMAQHPVELNLKHVQCWGLCPSLERLFQRLTVPVLKNFPLVLSRNLPGRNLYPQPIVLVPVMPCKKGVPILFVATL